MPGWAPVWLATWIRGSVELIDVALDASPGIVAEVGRRCAACARVRNADLRRVVRIAARMTMDVVLNAVDQSRLRLRDHSSTPWLPSRTGATRTRTSAGQLHPPGQPVATGHQ